MRVKVYHFLILNRSGAQNKHQGDNQFIATLAAICQTQTFLIASQITCHEIENILHFNV